MSRSFYSWPMLGTHFSLLLLLCLLQIFLWIKSVQFSTFQKPTNEHKAHKEWKPRNISIFLFECVRRKVKPWLCCQRTRNCISKRATGERCICWRSHLYIFEFCMRYLWWTVTEMCNNNNNRWPCAMSQIHVSNMVFGSLTSYNIAQTRKEINMMAHERTNERTRFCFPHSSV